jgi:carbamoyl-phosphate synthase/aspartate carbamoyltransferase/dihydroorotase
MDDLIQRMVIRPRQIFSIAEQPDTWVEVGPDEEWEIHAANNYSRCGWTPFEGRKVRGRVRRVWLRGTEVYRDQQVLAHPGFGKNIRQPRFHNISVKKERIKW